MEQGTRIGELLLEAGVVSADQLREGLAEQARSGGRLCHSLMRLGYLRADDLLGFLREQFGVAAVNLERYTVPPEVLALVPAAFARERRVVPLHVLDGRLTLAAVDPSREGDLRAVRELTGLEPEAVIAPEASLEAALERFYPERAEVASAEGGLLEIGGEAEGGHLTLGAAPPEGLGAEEWLRRFVLQGVRKRSREIHLESCEEGLRARYRVHGALVEGETAPPPVRAEVVRAALALAGGGGPDLRVPVEGRFRIRIRTRRLAATLAAFPTLRGGRLVLRILDESFVARGFQELGMSRDCAEEIERILGRPAGLLLLCGPAGAGRTTTLYSLVARRSEDGGRNVMTLESPVRFPLPGVSQTPVGGGLDFASGVRAVLRQEPDVLGVMEVPDRETLDLLLTAARRCLVIARCPARDAREALAWLADAGVGPATEGMVLLGVLSQRLLAKICSGCRRPLEEPVRLVEGVRGSRVEELSFYAGRGCEQCSGTGRSGRVALFELLSFRGALRDMLRRGDPAPFVVDEAQRLGMWTLREDGVHKASQGLVDIREVLEATAAAGEPEP